MEVSGPRKAFNPDGSEHVWGAEENKHIFTINVDVRGAHEVVYGDENDIPFQVVERAFNLRDAVAQAAERPFGDWCQERIKAERNEDHEEALRPLVDLVESIQQYIQDDDEPVLTPTEDKALRESLLAELVKASAERMEANIEPVQVVITEHSMLEAAQAKLVSIKVALGRVAVYDGLVDHSPTEMMVDDLVRDHEELEARIDAVLHYVSSHEDGFDTEQFNEVSRLLKGGVRIPDSPEGLT